MTDAGYGTTVQLKSGLGVRLRSIRPDDKQRLAEAFRNLEPESIYTRFFFHKKMLSDEELKAATEVDFDTVVGLVVTIGEGAQETIIGAGRYATYAADDGKRQAEVSFTVEEDYQGQGMAGLLMRHLTAIAREKRISRFTAEVLAGNKAMLAVFAHSGLPMQTTRGTDVVHVTLSLEAIED